MDKTEKKGKKKPETYVDPSRAYRVYLDSLVDPRRVDARFHLLCREVDTICRAIEYFRGSCEEIALALGLSRYALRRKLIKYGMPLLRDQKRTMENKE